MTELIVLRALGDICLYFAMVGAFPLFFTHDFMLLYPALLCAAGVGLGAALDRKWPGFVKYAALLLPVAAFLLADEPMEYLILIPVMVYAFAVLRGGAYMLEYFSFLEQYLRFGKILCGFGVAIFALGYFEGMVGDSWEGYDISAVLLYGMLYGLSGVFLLRQLRLGVDSRPQDRLANNIQMLAVLAVILVLSVLTVALEDMLRETVASLLYAITGLFSLVPMAILELIRWFLRDNGGYMDTMESIHSKPSESVEMTYPSMQGAVQVPPEDPGFPWWMAVLILAALCCMIIYLLRTLGKGSGAAGSGSEMELVEESTGRRRGSRRSNRAKIRKLYRSYLKLVRRKGQRLEKNQTTADILEKHPENVRMDAAERLRALYVKARYDEDSPVTDRDVELAKEAMQQVTNYHKEM